MFLSVNYLNHLTFSMFRARVCNVCTTEPVRSEKRVPHLVEFSIEKYQYTLVYVTSDLM